jgi:hypothetical protein
VHGNLGLYSIREWRLTIRWGFWLVSKKWCERGESNPHTVRRQILSLVRLPVPPPSHPIFNLQANSSITVRLDILVIQKTTTPVKTVLDNSELSNRQVCNCALCFEALKKSFISPCFYLRYNYFHSAVLFFDCQSFKAQSFLLKTLRVAIVVPALHDAFFHYR